MGGNEAGGKIDLDEMDEIQRSIMLEYVRALGVASTVKSAIEEGIELDPKDSTLYIGGVAFKPVID